MSGFFQCYYYHGSNQEDVYNILVQSRQHGYIFSPQNGWIQFVAEGQPMKLNDSIVQASMGLLIHMIYAEDHGWEYHVFNKAELVSHYICRWDNEIRFSADDYFQWIFTELGINIDPIRQLLFPSSNDIKLIYNNDPAEAFCKLLGLRSIDSVSFYYLDRHLQIYLDSDPGIISV